MLYAAGNRRHDDRGTMTIAYVILNSQVYLHFSQRRRIKMETLLILSCVLIILAIPFGIKESIAVKKVRIEKTAKLLGYDPVFDK